MTIHIRISGDDGEQHEHLDRMGEAIADFVNSGGFVKVSHFNSYEELDLSVERRHRTYAKEMVPSLWRQIHQISPGFIDSEVMVTVAPRYGEEKP